MTVYKIISNSNPEVAEFTEEDGGIITHALKPGTTILVYEEVDEGIPRAYRVNVS